MTPLERVTATLSGEEPDRVPAAAIIGTVVARTGWLYYH